MKLNAIHSILDFPWILAVSLSIAALLMSAACSEPAREDEKESAPSASEELATPSNIEGLWAYTGIAPGGGDEMPLTGLFVFHNGIFVQQAINDGEPFEQQMGQAHTGTYAPAEKGFDMVAELAIGVAPSRTPALSLRRNTEHQINAERSGEELVLTFGSGTVQKFEWVGSGEGEVFSLDEGRLALVDGHFLLVAAQEGRVVAGSGSFEREGDTVAFHAMRWFSVNGEEVTYKKDEAIDAAFDGQTLTLADGTTFSVKE